MKIKKGEIYYYFNKFEDNEDFIFLEIECLSDYEGEHGVMSGWKIKDVISNIDSGYNKFEKISGNQMVGVGVNGLNKFLYNNKNEIIVRLFKL